MISNNPTQFGKLKCECLFGLIPLHFNISLTCYLLFMKIKIQRDLELFMRSVK